MTLNQRIEMLEKQLRLMTDKVNDLTAHVEEKYRIPISIVGGGRDRGMISSIDIKAGMGQIYGGSIIWNSSELGNPPANTEPSVPDEKTGKAYNKHSHSRFSGGALIKNVLEIVEYNADDWVLISNPHSQQFWQTTPRIAKEINTNKEQVEKIGLLDLVFNPDTQTWGVAALEIDVKKCYFVERDDDGDIALDSKGQQKRSPLWKEDTNKTSIVWDENAACFRLYAVYAPGES